MAYMAWTIFNIGANNRSLPALPANFFCGTVGKVNGALEEKGIFSKKQQFLVFNDVSVAGKLAVKKLGWLKHYSLY